MIKRRSRIGQRIFYSLLIVSVFPLLILLIYTSTVYYDNLKENVLENERVVQAQSVHDLSLFLHKAEFITNECYDSSVQKILRGENISLVEQVENQNFLMNQINTKMDLFRILSDMETISIYTKDGTYYKVRRSSEGALETDISPDASQMQGLANLNLDTSYKHQMLLKAQNGAIYFIRKINDTENNKYLATIVLQFDSELLAQSFPTYTQEDSYNHILISNENNDVLYCDIGFDREAIGQFHNMAADSNQYIKNYESLEGDGINITILTNQKELLKPVDTLRIMTALIIIFSYLLVIIISNFVSKSLVRPLINIRKGIDKIAEGNYSYSLNIKSTDELGDVAHAFEKMSHEIDKLINEVYATELNEKEATIASLTSQINPHFLYNTLDMVKSMAEIDGNEDISDIVKALSVLFRYSTKTDTPIVSVKEEIENLDNYIKIIDARFGSKIKFNILCQDDVKDCQIMKLCLQPLVENSIQHGLLNKNNTGNIIINITSDGKFLKIVEQDNGMGMDEQEFKTIVNDLKKSKKSKTQVYDGVGLKNINGRIKLYYGEEYGVELSNYPGDGLMVEILIPLESCTDQ
jgi:sensor histidine kinase YesM